MAAKCEYDLSGERLFLTGGARGMGRGMAETFARWGATVGVADVDEDGAQGTKEAIVAGGGRACAHRIDVTDEHSVEGALEGFLGFAGGIDLSVHAAGLLSVSAVVDLELDEWRRVLDVNATGTFLVARACARAMIARGTEGSIVCIASVGGRVGSPWLAHYAASKFAVIGFVQSLSREIGRHGIRVNTVCPGTVDTPMLDTLIEGRSLGLRDFVNLQVIKRPQTPAEIAAGVAALHVNGAITGQALNVDGGTIFS